MRSFFSNPLVLRVMFVGVIAAVLVAGVVVEVLATGSEGPTNFSGSNSTETTTTTNSGSGSAAQFTNDSSTSSTVLINNLGGGDFLKMFNGVASTPLFQIDHNGEVFAHSFDTMGGKFSVTNSGSLTDNGGSSTAGNFIDNTSANPTIKLTQNGNGDIEDGFFGSTKVYHYDKAGNLFVPTVTANSTGTLPSITAVGAGTRAILFLTPI